MSASSKPGGKRRRGARRGATADRTTICERAINATSVAQSGYRKSLRMITAASGAPPVDANSADAGLFPVGSFPVGSFPVGSFPVAWG